MRCSCLMFVGLTACAPPGVTEVVLGPPIVAGASAPRAAGVAGMEATGGKNQLPPSVGAAAVSGTTEAAGSGGSTGAATATAMTATGTSAVAAAPTASLGAAAGSGAAGSAASAASAAGSGGTASPSMNAACPAGWMCVDPVASSPIPGLLFKDAMGMQVPYTCTDGSMMVVDCDDANPKASCSALDNPICAHIDVAGESLTACAQRCMP